MKLNEKIAYYRREKKLSQEELAAQVGVSRQAVSKWELGDASPDVNKLLALSKAFGISTDHLLDEEEKPERDAPAPSAQETSAPPPPPAPSGQGQFNNLPGFIGKMVRRWGWLAGIYIALQGAGLTLFGIVGRFMFSSFFESVGGMGFGGDPFGGFPGDYVIYNESGQVIQSGSSGVSGFSGIQSAMLAVPTLALIIGIIMVVGGLILAYVLWKNGKKGN